MLPNVRRERAAGGFPGGGWLITGEFDNDRGRGVAGRKIARGGVLLDYGNDFAFMRVSHTFTIDVLAFSELIALCVCVCMFACMFCNTKIVQNDTVEKRVRGYDAV